MKFEIWDKNKTQAKKKKNNLISCINGYMNDLVCNTFYPMKRV